MLGFVIPTFYYFADDLNVYHEMKCIYDLILNRHKNDTMKIMELNIRELKLFLLRVKLAK
jgi:hypothetical protein